MRQDGISRARGCEALTTTRVGGRLVTLTLTRLRMAAPARDWLHCAVGCEPRVRGLRTVQFTLAALIALLLVGTDVMRVMLLESQTSLFHR